VTAAIVVLLATTSFGCSDKKCGTVIRDEAKATGTLHFKEAGASSARDETFDVPMTTPLSSTGRTGRYSKHEFTFQIGGAPPIGLDVTLALLPDTGATAVDDQSAQICAGANACQTLYGAPIVIVTNEDCGSDGVAGSGCAENIDLEIEVRPGDHFSGDVHILQREHFESRTCD